MQAVIQANQLASPIDCAGNITNFIENRTSKSFLVSHNSKEMCSLIFVFVIKKNVSGKHPIYETNTHMNVFIKDIIRKMKCYWLLPFFFDLY